MFVPMKRILLVRTDRVGDLLMITPAIRELKLAYPDSFLAVLARPNTSLLLKNNPYIDSIITDDLSKESFWQVVKKIREYDFTHGLMFMPTERGAWQMFWGGVKYRVGVGRKLYEVMTGMKSVSRNKYNPLRHEADYCLDLVRKLGVVTNNLQPELYITSDEKEEAVRFLVSKNIGKEKRIIVVHTGSFGSAPNWSEDKYIELLGELLKNVDNGAILLTAMEMSNNFTETVSERFKGEMIFNISKEIGDLRHFAALINEADLFIGSSTGPAHMADALNKKCVVIHCHRPMNRPAHWGIINNLSINLEVDEQFCNNNCSADKKDCRLNEGVQVKEVISAALKLLNYN
jgi:ADP-heptose:LPS heptosyltransferase